MLGTVGHGWSHVVIASRMHLMNSLVFSKWSGIDKGLACGRSLVSSGHAVVKYGHEGYAKLVSRSGGIGRVQDPLFVLVLQGGFSPGQPPIGKLAFRQRVGPQKRRER